MIAVNLIPAPRRLAAARRKRITRWCMAGAAYGVALAAIAAAAWVSGRGGGALESRLQEVSLQAAQAETQTKKVMADLVSAQERLAAIRRVTGHPDWSVLLSAVSSAREGRVVFDTCELEAVVPKAAASVPAVMPAAGGPATATPAAAAPPKTAPGYLLRLSGLARQQREIPQFVLRLEAMRLFEKVALLESQSRMLDGTEVYGFRIECTLRDGGGTTR